jgi:hypothetical protein
MKTKLLILPGMLLAVALLATCTEQPAMAPDNDVEAVTPTLSSAIACDLVSQMTSDVRDYFQMPERRDAAAEMRLLGDACSAGTQTLMTSLSIGLLVRIETAAQTNRGLSPVIGARLAQALLACTTDAGCSASAVAQYSLPSLSDLEDALSHAGLFAVRAGTNGTPAIARAKVPFDVTNGGLFGTQLTAGSWTQANGGGALVLLYGFPITPSVSEASVGNLGYSFNRWPDPGPFIADGLVIVGVCFTNDVDVPHPATAESSRGRIQRDGAGGTLLSFHAPTFSSECRTPPANASLFGPARNFALSLLPRAWSAMFMTDIRTPVIGGGSIDWSDFAPVGADTAGSLVITQGPKATYTVEEPLMIRVLAQSGDLTPMERVPVELYVAGNSGTPAGAFVTDLDPSANDGTWGFTSEADGTILFDMAGLGKPGGYTLCARVRTPPGFAGFTFTEACTQGVFNVMQ